MTELASLRSRNQHSFLGIKKSDFFNMVVLVALAALTRAPGLGTWCVNSDEYLLSRSIAFIQETGLPRFPSGGYYVRGILYQYLMTIPVSLFPDREFSLRLLPLLFGILTIPMLYLLCRKMMPKFLAFLCGMILVLSSWHIEFSRFARFYTAFQFLFFLFLYYVYADIQNDNKTRRLMAIATAFIAIFVFEASIFLPFILLVTYLFCKNDVDRKSFSVLLCVFIILMAFNYLANGINYRDIGVENALPVDFSGDQSNNFHYKLPINLPTGKLILFIWNSRFLMAVYGLLFCAGIYVAYRLLMGNKTDGDLWSSALVISIAALPLFHLFAVLGFILVLLLINKNSLLNLYTRNMRTINLYIASVLLFWILVILYSGNTNKIIHYLVGYPPIKTYIIAPYYDAVPLWGLWAVTIMIVSTIRLVFKEKNDTERFVLTILILCILLLPVFRLPEYTTRYSFFFYPLIIILWGIEAGSMKNWYMAKRGISNYGPVPLLVMCAPMLLFVTTDDFNYAHLKNVSAKEANFRIGKYEKYQEHWYERFDYESPASFVNTHYSRGDAVVVDSNPFGEYLNVPYHFYSPYNTHWFEQFSRNFGNEEIWSGKPMFHELAHVAQAIPAGKGHSLWLLSKDQVSGGVSVAYFAKDYDLRIRREYTGVDNRYKVWKLSREPESATPTEDTVSESR